MNSRWQSHASAGFSFSLNPVASSPLCLSRQLFFLIKGHTTTAFLEKTAKESFKSCLPIKHFHFSDIWEWLLMHFLWQDRTGRCSGRSENWSSIYFVEKGAASRLLNYSSNHKSRAQRRVQKDVELN